MAEELTQISLSGGRYEGVLTGAEKTEIEALHRGRIVAVARLVPHPSEAGAQAVSVDLPSDVLSDGVQVVGLRSTATGEILDRITLLAGSALSDDIRSEIALLRDELEMLKQAFRQHCSDASGD
ncbi:hypothetical protein V8J82_07500 [Gymnodinialimonas sp. 2305UL16-5]|uniref:hypothetical protein n=1 Tax=Gymnodinialimonas mytili TaxID=3126503 RepID=UPI0030AC81D5